MPAPNKRFCVHGGGQVGWDRILGWSDFIEYLDICKVVNFKILWQYIAMFGGKIVG